jgi:crossover junction endodeoxyribonuclease RuvC
MLVKNRLLRCSSNCWSLKEFSKISTDGLAAAVCHFFNSGKVVGTKKLFWLGCIC